MSVERGKIYLNGVDYSGSIIDANPTIPSGVTPTNLSSLKIDDNYYNISGGGGGSSITTYEKTITTSAYGWWFVEDENGNPLDPSVNTLLKITPIVDVDLIGDVYLDAFFFARENSQDGNGYLMDLCNINDGGFIRYSMTIKVRVSYI